MLAIVYEVCCINNMPFSPIQRQSNHSSSSGGGGYTKSTATSPYQSQLYDSWKTEWDGYYDDHFR